MPDIDFTSAYRDATKGSTIKALGQRRAELAAALAARRPREINSPWQGAAEVADTISGSIREGRLANQEAAGRQRFAELLAGGLAPDEIGEAMGLDPETTMKYQERTWAKEDTDAQRKEAERIALRGHGWDVEKQTAEVEARRAEQEAGFTHSDEAAKAAAANASDSDLREAALRADNPVAIDEAMKRGLIPTADGEAMKKQINDKAAADIAAKAPDQWTAVTPEIAAQYGPDSDVAKNPGLYHVNTKTNDIERIDQNAFGSMSPAAKEFDIQSAKDNQDWVATGRAQSVSNQVQLDKVLADLDKFEQGSGTVSGGFSKVTGIGAPSGVVTGVLPDPLNRFLAGGTATPDPVTMRENVRTVAQQSLKAVLGTQFAAVEGEGVMARAYDPGAAPAENARRVRLLKIKLDQVAKYNDMRADWLAKKGTMQGFTGPTPAEIQADFLAYTNSPEFTGGGEADTGTSADTGAYSEDDILETMRANNMTREQVMDALAQQGGR